MLTDTSLRSLKPAAKPVKKADNGGLFVLVPPVGPETLAPGIPV